MAHGMYHYIREAWKNPDNATLKERMIAWRRSDAAEVVDKPLRLDRARSLGYKAKRGFVVVRIRLLRGGRKRERAGVKGRKSRKQYARKILKMSYQWVAEIRAARKFPNLEVLNSYPLGKDGKHGFYEVIMVDPDKPEIKNDPNMKWIVQGANRKRAERGLTSAARKSRGLSTKSRTLKVRPSGRAWNRKGK
ncbi:MAG TPA: 50S ribosomal protein L15e [Candidatus Nanoarchaeia archaeon]|nr:50S ribosomal protein L15e [Candidatus Nanoarchaeia archaeon]